MLCQDKGVTTAGCLSRLLSQKRAIQVAAAPVLKLLLFLQRRCQHVRDPSRLPATAVYTASSADILCLAARCCPHPLRPTFTAGARRDLPGLQPTGIVGEYLKSTLESGTPLHGAAYMQTILGIRVEHYIATQQRALCVRLQHHGS